MRKTENTVVNMHRDGMSVAEIAQELCMEEHWVTSILHESGEF